jgi:hypothetical protein
LQYVCKSFFQDTEDTKPEKPHKKKPAKSRKAPKVVAQDDVSNIDNDDL